MSFEVLRGLVLVSLREKPKAEGASVLILVWSLGSLPPMLLILQTCSRAFSIKRKKQTK